MHQAETRMLCPHTAQCFQMSFYSLTNGNDLLKETPQTHSYSLSGVEFLKSYREHLYVNN